MIFCLTSTNLHGKVHHDRHGTVGDYLLDFLEIRHGYCIVDDQLHIWNLERCRHWDLLRLRLQDLFRLIKSKKSTKFIEVFSRKRINPTLYNIEFNFFFITNTT